MKNGARWAPFSYPACAQRLTMVRKSIGAPLSKCSMNSRPMLRA
jgi:hypothetical protein